MTNVARTSTGAELIALIDRAKTVGVGITGMVVPSNEAAANAILDTLTGARSSVMMDIMALADSAKLPEIVAKAAALNVRLTGDIVPANAQAAKAMLDHLAGVPSLVRLNITNVADTPGFSLLDIIAQAKRQNIEIKGDVRPADAVSAQAVLESLKGTSGLVGLNLSDIPVTAATAPEVTAMLEQAKALGLSIKGTLKPSDAASATQVLKSLEGARGLVTLDITDVSKSGMHEDVTSVIDQAKLANVVLTGVINIPKPDETNVDEVNEAVDAVIGSLLRAQAAGVRFDNLEVAAEGTAALNLPAESNIPKTLQNLAQLLDAGVKFTNFTLKANLTFVTANITALAASLITLQEKGGVRFDLGFEDAAITLTPGNSAGILESLAKLKAANISLGRKEADGSIVETVKLAGTLNASGTQGMAALHSLTNLPEGVGIGKIEVKGNPVVLTESNSQAVLKDLAQIRTLQDTQGAQITFVDVPLTGNLDLAATAELKNLPSGMRAAGMTVNVSSVKDAAQLSKVLDDIQGHDGITPVGVLVPASALEAGNMAQAIKASGKKITLGMDFSQIPAGDVESALTALEGIDGVRATGRINVAYAPDMMTRFEGITDRIDTGTAVLNITDITGISTPQQVQKVLEDARALGFTRFSLPAGEGQVQTMILDVVKAAQGTGTALTQFSFDLASLSPEAARNFTQAAIAAGLATLTFELGNFAPDKVELFMEDMEQVLLAAKQEQRRSQEKPFCSWSKVQTRKGIL